MDLLFRIHGSAVASAFLPAVASTCGLIVAVYAFDLDIEAGEKAFDHPYAIGVLFAAFTYLITFRANFGYGRYWQAATSVFDMMSKWVDVGMEMAAFHYQSQQYDSIRPPSFGMSQNKAISRDRERIYEMTAAELETVLDKAEEDADNEIPKTRLQRIARKFQRNNQEKGKKAQKMVKKKMWLKKIDKSLSKEGTERTASDNTAIPVPSRGIHAASSRDEDDSVALSSTGRPRLERINAMSKLDGGITTREPSLFLQEGTHLLSLLSAVAMSTLRCDVEGAEAPLVEYVPRSPLPPVDPDRLDAAMRKQYISSSRVSMAIRFVTRTARNRTNLTFYNAARPFQVLGGISDAEIKLLQEARGPSAKVSLCFMWLQEFVSREYQDGSTGAMAGTIIGRLHQFSSDGMKGYHQARKVAYTPFPFPHAQLTIMYIFVVVCFCPVLMFSYINNLTFACILNFFTVLCFAGMHEVARELEDPFFNVPNDLPLTTFQAQFNEALIAMYAGFHPDSLWDVPTETTASKSEAGGAAKSLGLESVPELSDGPSSEEEKLEEKHV